MSEHDYFVEFARELGQLNGNLTAVLKRIEERMAKNDEMMARHEARISVLESHGRPQGDGDADWRRVAFALLKYGGWVLAILIWLLGIKLPS